MLRLRGGMTHLNTWNLFRAIHKGLFSRIELSSAYRQVKHIVLVFRSIYSRLSKRSTLLLMCAVLRKSSLFKGIDTCALLTRQWTEIKPFLQPRIKMSLPSLLYPKSNCSAPVTISDSMEENVNIPVKKYRKVFKGSTWALFRLNALYLLRFVAVNVDAFALCGDWTTCCLIR